MTLRRRNAVVIAVLLVVAGAIALLAATPALRRAVVPGSTVFTLKRKPMPSLLRAYLIGFARPTEKGSEDWLVCIRSEADDQYWFSKTGTEDWSKYVPVTAEDMLHIGLVFRLRANSHDLLPVPNDEWIAVAGQATRPTPNPIAHVDGGDQQIMPPSGDVGMTTRAFGTYPRWVVQIGNTRVLASCTKHTLLRQDSGKMSDSYGGSLYYEVFLPPYETRTGPPILIALDMKERTGVKVWAPDGRVLICILDNNVAVVRIEDLINADSAHP